MQRIYNILVSILGESKQGYYDKGTTQYQFNCPYCADEKGGVDNKYNLEISFALGKYHCWSCGSAGPISKLIRAKGGKPLADEYFRLIQDIKENRFFNLDMFKDNGDITGDNYLKLPKTFEKINLDTCRDKALLSYLDKRHITQDIIDFYGIGRTTWNEDDWSWRNRIVIPSYNSAGDLNYYVGRLFRDKDKSRKDKYKNCKSDKNEIVFCEDKIQWDSTIYLVEGAIDSIYYPNAISLLGKTLTMDTLLYHRLRDKANADIVICLDGDTDIKETMRIYKLLDRDRLHNRIRFIRLGTDSLPYKDFGEIYEAEEHSGIIKAMKSANKFSEIELNRI